MHRTSDNGEHLNPTARRLRLVVVGNGMAGARVVEEVLKRDPALYDITMIGKEPYGNYNRILLSNVLNGSQEARDIFLNPLAWYAENGIRLIAGASAVSIDRQARRVILQDSGDPSRIVSRLGTPPPVPYDTLILATGSRPFVPDIPGTDLDGVFLFRTLDDCTAIASRARRSRQAVVIGGGLLGLEAARGLMGHGPRVIVVERAPHLMSVQLDAGGGAVLARTIAALGIGIHADCTTTEILGDADGRVMGLRFSDGQELPCDMVVISAGIRPNVELAKAAGLTVERAIVVNDRLRTDDPRIFAVGECVQHRGQTYGLVAPIWEQCQVLADHLTGAAPDAVYRGSLLATRLKVMGVNVASIGQRDEREGDEVVRFEEPAGGIYQKLIIRDGRVVGASLVGDIGRYSELVKLMQSKADLPERRAELLFGPCSWHTGDPSRPGTSTLADLPDDHQICDCNGVSKGAVCAAIEEHHCTVAAVGRHTRAGTGCGSCRKLIKGLIEAIAGEERPDPSESWYVPAIPLDKPSLITEVKRRGLRSVSAVLAALGQGDDARSRMGLASLLKSIWHAEYIDERDSRFINDRVHANIQKDGTFSVVPRIYGGVTSAEELIRIGQVARKYDVPMVKITGGQRIDLLGLSKEDLPRVWKDLGMPSGFAYTKAFRTCKTCVGSEFCRFGTNDSTSLGIAIEKRFQGIEFPAKVKMAVSGCPRNCAEATVKDIGVVAGEGGEWEVVVGGAAGASVRKADTLARVRSREDAIRIIGRFMQYYREHARYLERTYDFVPRIGIEKLREMIVNDSEGIGEGLDREIQASIDAYVDPWEAEAKAPAHPEQFSGTRRIPLPVLG